MKLTAKNYHSPKNHYLSNSKISLFLKSKAAYKKHFIDHEDGFEMTSSMMIGKAVDAAFEKGNLKVIDKMFCKKVLRRDNALAYDAQQSGADTRICLTDTQYETAIAMSKKILESKMYKEYKKGKKTKFQVVVKDDERQICGLVDAITIDHENKTIFVDDLKTAAPMSFKSKTSWYWHCVEFSYLRQLAVYKNLLSLEYPDYQITCRHIVIGSGDYFNVRLFIIDDSLLENEWQFFLKTAYAIRKETKWVDYVPGWPEAQLITQPELK